MVLRSSGHSSSIFLEPFAPPALPGFIATMAPLTPAGRVSGARQVSLLHGLNLLTVPSPITLCRSDRLACFLDRTYRRNCSEEPVPPTQAGQRRRQLGFAMGLLARRDKRPYRVRHPTDRSFTSWCSPHPLAGTQFRSVTAVRPTTDRDSHPADSIHSQSHSPGRKPGDCGNKGHPLATPLEPGSWPIGAPRNSPPARAGGFYCRTRRADQVCDPANKCQGTVPGVGTVPILGSCSL